MKKKVGLYLFMLLPFFAMAQGKVLDKIVATVDDNIILLSDIEIQKKQKTVDPFAKDVDCVFLDQMLLEKMFVAKAKIDSLVVSEDEVSSELDRRMRYFISAFGSKEKLEEYYKKSTLELKNDFREDVRNQLMGDRMRGKINGNITITPSEVKEFYNKIPADSLPYFNAEVQVAQIVLLPKIGKEQKREARLRLEEIRKEIEKGADFTTQAVLYSDDPGSSSAGGDLGIINRGELVPEFEAVAFNLPENKVSEIVETQYGYHIIEVLEKRGEKIKVRHILVTPKVTGKELEFVRHKADSIHTLIKSKKISFDKAVSEFSEDAVSKQNGGIMQNPATGSQYFEASELDGQVAFVLEKLKAGEISDVTSYTAADGKRGYRILKLISESSPHRASLEKDYTKIKNAAQQAKQAEAMQKWILENKKDIFIKIDPSYTNCEAMQKWITK